MCVTVCGWTFFPLKYGRIREHRLCLVENMYCYVYLSALYIRFMGHIRGGIHGMMMEQRSDGSSVCMIF